MSRFKFTAFALAMLMLASLACSAVTSSPEATTAPPAQPTAAPAPTSAPQPAATDTRAPTAARPTATAALPTGVLFNEDFSSQKASEDKGWTFGTGESVDWNWSTNKLTALVKQESLIGWNSISGNFDNFGAELEAQAVTNDYAEYGIIFRIGGTKDARNYYIFGVTTTGKYFLQKRVGGKWASPDPLPATASTYIKPKAKNVLSVLAQGNRLSLYINTFLVKTMTDDSFASGNIGVFASTGEDNDTAQVAFSRLTILTTQKAQADWGAAPASSGSPPTATAAAGTGPGTIIVRNTFPGACQANLFGRQEAVIRAEGNSSASKVLQPGTYGVHLAVDIGEVDLNQFYLPPGGVCVLTCDAATKSVYNSCR